MLLSHPTFLSSLLRIRSLLRTALGPRGRAVLLSRAAPRHLTLTRSGLDILQPFLGVHPFTDILIRAVENLLSKTGEGSKRAFLAMVDLVERVNRWEESRAEAVARLTRLGKATISASATARHTRLYRNTAQLTLEAALQFSLACRLGGDTETGLSPPHSCLATQDSGVASRLAQLCAALVRAECGSPCTADRLDQLRHGLLGRLVEVGGRPVRDSKVGEGVWLQAGLTLTTARLGHSPHPVEGVRLVVAAQQEAAPPVTLNLTGQVLNLTHNQA